MKIEANRLVLRPLTSAQLECYRSDPKRFSKAMGIRGEVPELSDHMKKVYHFKAKRIKEDPATLLYNTYFIIILKKTHQLVGFLGLKGRPDEEGRVEVGYEIEAVHRNNGYMREALAAFVRWITLLSEVRGVDACTSQANVPSHRVLSACGFKPVYTAGDMIVWRYP